MRKPATLLLILLVALVAACSSDTSEQIEGVWNDTVTGTYIEYDEEGQYQVDFTPRFGDPFEWGTYTFDGETLTASSTSPPLQISTLNRQMLALPSISSLIPHRLSGESPRQNRRNRS